MLKPKNKNDSLTRLNQENIHGETVFSTNFEEECLLQSQEERTIKEK